MRLQVRLFFLLFSLCPFGTWWREDRQKPSEPPAAATLPLTEAPPCAGRRAQGLRPPGASLLASWAGVLGAGTGEPMAAGSRLDAAGAPRERSPRLEI